ncbi:MAG: hypothetical protein A3G41_04120 [Elusimicrobia bacterium RIFCSPLOWO2_12_FULL_59_9]|nr:MAG: hypothetical protein A3G41_04120 [Elusimicrobia bacterium RIFCSPLOWO2_12_FULL_59_9]
MAYLARQPEGKFCLVEEVASQQKLPANFLSKIFQRLARRELLAPRRGPGGGYALAKAAHKISMAEVVSAMEELPPEGNQCFLAFRGCGAARHCAIHDAAAQANDILWQALRRTSLLHLERRDR